MDAVLAILVLGTVIFFGALISVGNERQRQALEGIREQAALWAMQDLRLKREKLAREVKVDDPLGWFKKIVSKVVGRDFNLKVVESFGAPRYWSVNQRTDPARLYLPHYHRLQYAI